MIFSESDTSSFVTLIGHPSILDVSEQRDMLTNKTVTG